MRILFLELVDRNSIWTSLDESSSGTSSYDVERFEPNAEAVRHEDILELPNQLRSELFLSQVIWTLHYH
jgi:hypothetical protein